MANGTFPKRLGFIAAAAAVVAFLTSCGQQSGPARLAGESRESFLASIEAVKTPLSPADAETFQAALYTLMARGQGHGQLSGFTAADLITWHRWTQQERERIRAEMDRLPDDPEAARRALDALREQSEKIRNSLPERMD